MKRIITISSVLFFVALFVYQNTNANKSENKVRISYLMDTKLKWTEDFNEFADENTSHYVLSDEHEITMTSSYFENKTLYPKFLSQSKDDIFKELYEGKKLIHELMDYKNWTLIRSEKSTKGNSIIFEIEGSFVKNDVKKFFKEKYFVTPFGFILMSLDWTEKDKTDLVKTAQNDFEKIEFRVGK